MKSLTQVINERKTIQVKRKYSQYAPIAVGANAPVRQKILGFIAEKGSCCKSDLVEYIRTANEDSGRKTNINWLKKNAKYLTTYEQDGETHYKLSKLGQRVVKATTVNENRYFGVGDTVKYKDKKGKQKSAKIEFVVTREDHGKYELDNGDTVTGKHIIMKESEMYEACDKHEEYDEDCPECQKLHEEFIEIMDFRRGDVEDLFNAYYDWYKETLRNAPDSKWKEDLEEYLGGYKSVTDAVVAAKVEVLEWMLKELNGIDGDKFKSLDDLMKAYKRIKR